MHFKRLLTLAVMAIAAQSAAAQILIKNVTVADVVGKKLLPGNTVLVQDGKISVVDKGRMFKLPETTTILDGTGKFLVPGFTDAHVHFFQSGGLFARPDAIDLRKYQPYEKEMNFTHQQMGNLLQRYLKAGITSVIDVGANSHFLVQRDSFAGHSTVPNIYMTGALLTTYVPKVYNNLGQDGPFEKMETVEGVKASVRKQASEHADFIKIWYIVTDVDKEAGARKNLALVKAAIDEAHALHLRIAVHATERITAQLAVEAGADFLVHNIEDEVLTPAFVQLLKSHKVVVCPTLVVAGNYRKVFADEYVFSTRELSIAHPDQVATILNYPLPDTTLAKQYIKYATAPSQIQSVKTTDSISAVNLLMLQKAGVVIAAGTDAGNIGTQHASSYFEELKAMQAAGLSMWDLLQAATINGAKAVGKEAVAGSVQVGKVADLLLLSANPIDSLANWDKIDAIIRDGKLVAQDSLVKETPESLVQRQLNAYNAHNLEAFLAVYAEEVEVYTFPAKLMFKGKTTMRKEYEFLNRVPKLFCKLKNRIIQGNMVIDHEEITTGGPKPIYGIAVYVIENGKIAKVYFPDL